MINQIQNKKTHKIPDSKEQEAAQSSYNPQPSQPQPFAPPPPGYYVWKTFISINIFVNLIIHHFVIIPGSTAQL